MLILLTVLFSFLALSIIHEISPEMEARIMGTLAIMFGALISILIEWLRARRTRRDEEAQEKLRSHVNRLNAARKVEDD